MLYLSWQTEVDVRELLREPELTEQTDFTLASHEEKGPLADMVRLILTKPETDRGRFVLTVGERVYRRKEIEHLATRPDFPTGRIPVMPDLIRHPSLLPDPRFRKVDPGSSPG